MSNTDNPSEDEVFALMRITEMLQGVEGDASSRELLCKVYWLGRKDEKEGR